MTKTNKTSLRILKTNPTNMRWKFHYDSELSKYPKNQMITVPVVTKMFENFITTEMKAVQIKNDNYSTKFEEFFYLTFFF